MEANYYLKNNTFERHGIERDNLRYVPVDDNK